jgi:hypothetical protein
LLYSWELQILKRKVESPVQNRFSTWVVVVFTEISLGCALGNGELEFTFAELSIQWVALGELLAP